MSELRLQLIRIAVAVIVVLVVIAVTGRREVRIRALKEIISRLALRYVGALPLAAQLLRGTLALIGSTLQQVSVVVADITQLESSVPRQLARQS